MEYTLGVEKCGCYIQLDRDDNAWIVYCPLHKSAPDLYGALKELMERFNGGVRFPLQSTCDKANQALSKAKNATIK